MDIRGERVLILGGSGLVGMAVARQLCPLAPATLVISGLTRGEAEAAVRELATEPGADAVELIAAWGDVFVPEALKDRRRADILRDPAARGLLLDELFGPVGPDSVARSTLGALLLRERPAVIVDCINTATVLAYQNVFSSAAALREAAEAGTADLETVERHLATLYLPQLIRHAQIALEAMRGIETRLYFKIGTAGTGGMGLNIPFTHSEERPSRMLLAKSSIAGAHTLLLFLMSRTPGAPAAKEIKPTAAISWKRIGFGEIMRGGRPIPRVDSLRPLPIEQAFGSADAAEPAWSETGEALEGVFLDAGENGLFSPAEFETLTALGLMEFITPEEIAQDVVREIRGHPTGHDVVAALDGATSGPTYRAGVLRSAALAHMAELERKHGVRSIAYEMLGPPRLSKLLFEAALLGELAGGDLDALVSLDPEETTVAAERLIREDADLRSRILSVGIPILLPDGEHLLRGPDVKVAPEGPEPMSRDRLADDGWVDLRAVNWQRWRDRIRLMIRDTEGVPGVASGSRRDIEPWEQDRRIRPGALAARIFRHEDAGERIKR